ncbi:MAG: hypothetical protein ACRCXD_17210 [Luteolibacter sp.]
MDGSHISAVDGFVLAMLGMMLLSGGVIVLLIICGLRNSAKRNQEVDDLLDEVSREPETQKTPHAATQPKPPQPEPWERDENWWRK